MYLLRQKFPLHPTPFLPWSPVDVLALMRWHMRTH